MKEIERFINKEIQKKYLELFMIIEQIARTENIISFNYDNTFLTVQVGLNDYYRIKIDKEV